MELRHLKYFVAAAEEMNLHRAAARLHISQPPLSVTIRQLEEEIGVPLFRREGRAIALTRAGTDFLVEARIILDRVERAVDATRHVGLGTAGRLKLGFVSSAVSGILYRMVDAVKVRCPGIVLEISQSTNTAMAEQVKSGIYDLGLIRWPEEGTQGLASRRLTVEGWSVAVREGHPLSRKKQVYVADLAGEGMIFYPRSNSPAGYDDVMALFAAANVTPRIVQEAPEQMTIAALAAGGMGVGLVPACMAAVPLPGLRHVPVVEAGDRTGFMLLCRPTGDALVERVMEAAMLA